MGGVKLFRRKRVLSSNVIWPYVGRFVRAARQLRERGVATVGVDDWFRVRGMGRDVVVYQYLEGRTLREVLAGDEGCCERRIGELAVFLADLHRRGIYFRAIHFGNVLLLEDGRFGLIDVSEVRFRRGALGLGLRAHNFKPLVRYTEDAAAIEAFGVGRFVDRYITCARLSASQAAGLRRRLAAIDPRFATPT